MISLNKETDLDMQVNLSGSVTDTVRLYMYMNYNQWRGHLHSIQENAP